MIPQLLALLVLLGGTTAALACPKSDCVRVGSWNIEWLGSDKRLNPSDDETVQQMASLVADTLSIDIIVFQEINTRFDGVKHGEHYSIKPWKKLEATLVEKGYRIFTGDSGYAQHLVIAWRNPVSVIRHPFEIDIPDHYDLHEGCRSARLRKPIAGYFRQKNFDFWVVGLHLKSSADRSSCSHDIRTAQVDDLLESMTRLSSADKDIVLAGDFNASSKHDSLSKLLEEGFDVISEKNYRSKASNSSSYYHRKGNKTGGSLIDHLMIRKEFTTEWQFGSTTIYKPADPDQFANTYSDHLPVWADFSIAVDDD